MAIGSGLGSQLGFINEGTYGTRVAPTKFVRARKAHIKRASNRADGEGIQPGVFGMIGAHHVETHEAGSASIELDVQSKTMGYLLQALMGSAAAPVQQAATAAWLQTHTLADVIGKMLTLQVNTPLRGGSDSVKELQGAKCTSASFSCSVGEILRGTFEFDGRKYDGAQTLAGASYVATNVFHHKQMAVKLGTFASEAAVVGAVRGVEVTISRPQDTESYTAGGAGLKNQPVLNGFTEISGTITADYTAKADFEDRFHAATSTSLVLEWVGPLIASTYYETFRIIVPGVFFTGDTANADGPGEITAAFPFTWRYDGTNLPRIEYMSTDTTL